jgi:hypothetical protein
MARIKGKDIYLNDDDQIYFGDGNEAALWYEDHELQLNHTISGIAPTKDGHLVTKKYVDDNIITVSGGIVQDHGQLLGLSDDDHTQYILANGSRGLSGNWNAGNYSITALKYYGNGSTLSGVAYVDGDDVYFYDTTRNKTLGVAIIEVGGARESVSTTDQYLRTYDGTPFNLSGSALPWDATLVGIVMSGEETNQTWTIQVRKNGSTTSLASLTINNAYENHDWSKDVDFSAGDRIQLYLSGTSIDYPQAKAYFRRRK